MKPFILPILLVITSNAFSQDLSWKQTANSLALVKGGQKVWQFNYSKEEGKPYFHPVTVAGSDTLTDLRPADHFWHRALWFSWKTINGVNYWEEDPKTGKGQGENEIVKVNVTPRPDHSARIEVSMSYHPPGKPPVLAEQRVIEVSAPSPAGAYLIDWQSTFTAGEADALLDRTPVPGEPQGVSWGGYAGLSFRLTPALKKWHFEGPDGVVTGASAQARWMGFTGALPNGKAASIVVLDHPKSFRHPTPWYLINDMPYFSPAVLYKSPYTLPAKKSLTLKYRILLQPGGMEKAAVENQWRRFSTEPVQ